MKNLIIPTTSQSAASHSKDGALFIIREIPDDATPQGPSFTVAETLDGYTALKPRPVRGPKVPTEIANWRAKAVLELAGLTAQVAAIMGAMSEPQKTVVLAAWDGGAPLVRNGATVTALAAALSLTSEQVDAMFVQAAALNV